MKKRVIAIIVTFFVIAAIVATLCWVSSLPDKPTDDVEKPENEGRKLVYTDDVNLFESITVKNENGEYTIVKSGDLFKIKGKENITLLPATSKAIFETFAEVYAVKTISNNDDTDGFGFENPSATLTLTREDGSRKVMLVGDYAPNTENCRYFRFEDEKTVYLLDNDRAKRYMGDVSVLYSKSVTKYFEPENLISFSLERSEDEDIYIRIATATEEKNPEYMSRYIVEKPFSFGGDSEVITSVLKTLATLPRAEIAEDEVTDAVLKEYGISGENKIVLKAKYDTTGMSLSNGEVNPYYDADNKEGFIELTTSYNLGKTENGKIYFIYDDLPIIYSINKSCFDFIETSSYLFYQRLINIAYLTDIEEFRVDLCEGDYDIMSFYFDIRVATDSNGNEYLSEVRVAKEPIIMENFQEAYEALVALGHCDIGEKPKKSEPLLKLDLYFRNGKHKYIDFLKVDERRCFMTVNGEGNFLVLTSKVNKLKDLINGAFVYP